MGGGGGGKGRGVVENPRETKEQEEVIAVGREAGGAGRVVVKSMQDFRAAFAPIAREILVVDSGALCSPARNSADFRKVRRPMWPFDPV